MVWHRAIQGVHALFAALLDFQSQSRRGGLSDTRRGIFERRCCRARTAAAFIPVFPSPID